MKYIQYLLVIILGLFVFFGVTPKEALANRAFNGTVYNYLSTPVQGVQVDILGILDHCDEQLGENPQACDHRVITTLTTGPDGRFVGGVGCEWLDLKYAIPSYGIGISEFGGEDECGNNSCYTAGVIQLPEPKSCTVSIAPNNAPAGNPMTITYSGRGWVGGENVRVLITKQDFGEFTGSSGSGGNNYKLLKGDCPPNTSCSVETPTDLPDGTYYAHCDLPTNPGKCSGARVCGGDGSGYSDLGGVCSGWKSCGNGDYTTFSVAGCPPPPAGKGPTVEGIWATRGTEATLNTFRISGNRAEQSGNNFLNELTVTAYGKAGSRPIERIYAIFYDESVYPNQLASSYQQLYDRISASPKEGFILAFGKNVLGDGDNTERWFVRNRNTWTPLEPNRDEIKGRVIDGGIVYNVWSNGSTTDLGSGQAGWNAEFRPGFDSKSMKTAVYVEDGVNAPAFSGNVETKEDPPVNKFNSVGCPI